MSDTIEYGGSRYVLLGDWLPLSEGDLFSDGHFITKIAWPRLLFISTGRNGRYHRMVEDYPDKEEKS